MPIEDYQSTTDASIHERIRKAAAAIMGTIAWTASPQGYDFWKAVYGLLQGIADRSEEHVAEYERQLEQWRTKGAGEEAGGEYLVIPYDSPTMAKQMLPSMDDAIAAALAKAEIRGVDYAVVRVIGRAGTETVTRTVFKPSER